MKLVVFIARIAIKAPRLAPSLTLHGLRGSYKGLNK